MAIQSMDAIIASLSGGKFKRADWNKNALPATAQVAGQWYDLSTGGGNPIQNAIIGSGTNLTFQAISDSTSTTAAITAPRPPQHHIVCTTRAAGKLLPARRPPPQAFIAALCPAGAHTTSESDVHAVAAAAQLVQHVQPGKTGTDDQDVSVRGSGLGHSGRF